MVEAPLVQVPQEEERLLAQHLRVRLDDVLENIGLGWRHVLLVVAAGVANSTDAFEVFIVPFLLPEAEDDLKLSAAQKGWLASTQFIGSFFGGILLGDLADRRGRKRTLQLLLLGCFLSSFASSFANSFGALFVLRIFAGFFGGGAVPIAMPYVAEFLPPSRRGAWLFGFSLNWMCGAIVATAIAWASLESLGWRVFVRLAASASAVAGLLLCVVPESPRSILVMQPNEEGVRRVARTLHHLRPSGSLQVDAVYDMLVQQQYYAEDEEKLGVKAALQSVLGTDRKLFFSALLTWFLIGFGFYGFFSWQPQYFSDFEEDSNYYLTMFLTSLAQLPGNLAGVALVDRMGRRRIVFVSMLLSAVAMAGIMHVTSHTQLTLVACVISAVQVFGWNALSILSTELFSARMRTTLFGIFAASCRIGAILVNLLFGYLFELSKQAPLYVSAAVSLLGGVVAIATLPRTRHFALD
ncbi:MAG: hypothetical protein MHM6MM_005336 [Cercozoa sp. M6MM]